MVRCLLFFVLLVLTTFCSSSLPEKTKIPAGNVLHVVDGGIAGNFISASGVWPTAKTLVLIRRGKNALLLRFACNHNKDFKLKKTGKNPDDMAIFAGEPIEIFLLPRPETSRYFQIAVNAGGEIYSAIGHNPAWIPENIETEINFQLDARILDMKIPYHTFNVPSPVRGEVWRAKFYRNHYGKTYSEFSNGAAAASYHDIARLGSIVFSPNEKDTPFDIESFSDSPAKISFRLGLFNIQFDYLLKTFAFARKNCSILYHYGNQKKRIFL